MLNRPSERLVLGEQIQTGWLVIALVAISATKLRLDSVPVGLGEIMLLGWVLWVVPKTPIAIRSLISVQGIVAWFWIGFGALTAIGTIWAHSKNIVGPGASRDAAAFMFAAIFSIIAAGTIGWRVSAIKAAQWTVGATAAYFGAFAIIHFVNPGLVTEPEFGDRLTGVTANPNQIALYLTAIPSLVIFLLWRTGDNHERVALLTALALCLFAGSAVDSDALALAWLSGAIASAAGLLMLRSNRNEKTTRIWVGIAIALTLVSSASGLLGRFLTPYDELRQDQRDRLYWEQNQVLTRVKLWHHGVDSISLSPIVGLGPGRHAGPHHDHALVADEAHNTFIDIATMAGIPGSLLFLWLLLAVSRPRRPMNQTEYDACVILLTVAIFASLHLVIRHPIFWFFVVLAGSLRRSNG